MNGPEIDITLWNGERFVMDYIAPLNFLVGPKLSGKGRFAQLLNRRCPTPSCSGKAAAALARTPWSCCWST